MEAARGSEAQARRDQQRSETEQFGVLGTAAQRRGIVVGTIVGGVIGAMVLGPFGLIGWGGIDVAVGVRIATLVIIGALAGSSAAAVYWGGRLPEIEGEADDERTEGDDESGY